ncbi:MAG: urea carboxylase [Victivallales bacterium]|jgi:urea carboxylase|nr:urea carboxylase [Victivallales bacterium]
MFKKVLIANRGEIACRIIRTLREMNIASVAVYSDPDEASDHVRSADESRRIGPAAPAASYLNTAEILKVAKETGAEAIHPGYGFLSENADFARECAANNIVFVGPTPEQLIDFGLKHRARELAKQYNVPLVPGTDLLDNVEIALTKATEIGYPVMLKSTAGGGGIGMCICRSENDLTEGFDRIGRLSKNNFKDSGLFLEKYIERSRHIEVQIFGNGRGGIAVLGERDCSTQRRNQKVIEETPAPNLDDNTRKALHDAARRLGEGVCYRSAGTVEFIYDTRDNRFYFLEVNTRLQVEHGITEEVFGIDLVRWMIEEAAGVDPIVPGMEYKPTGAAMEFRLYAEDPGKNYQPSSGLITEAEFPADIRCDKWIRRGTEVSAFYDPLLAKLIVKGETRADVLEKAAKALDDTQVCGFETNLLLLRSAVRIDSFRKGDVSTALLKDYVYSAPTFEILKPGAQTTIQDVPGRLGYWDVGVPPSGPIDDYDFRLANRIVGNSEFAPGIEITLTGPTIRFNTATVIAITGGKFSPKLNDQPIELFQPIQVYPGNVLKFGTTQCGQRAYLALRGGIDVPEYLGSRSTFTLGHFGGHGGRALSAGDVLHLGRWAESDACIPDSSVLPQIDSDWEIAVLYGPHGAPDYLKESDVKRFFEATWEVHYNSSRTGIRLIGPQFEWARPDGGEAGLHPSNLHDNAYAVGTLDFTGDMPVILAHDGPSLGGFVCPATIAAGDLWKIGQLRSGDRIRFVPISVKTAENLRKHQADKLLRPTEIHSEFTLDSSAPVTPIVTTFMPSDPMDHVVIRQDGDTYLLVEFGPAVLDLRLRFKAHAWMLKIKALNLLGIIDLTPGVRSLHIHFDPELLAQEDLICILSDVDEQLKSEKISKVKNRIVHLPLSWDDPATRLAIEKYVSTVRPGAPWCCPNNIEFIRRINGLATTQDVYDIVFNAQYLVMGLGDVYLGAPVATPLDPRQRLVTTKYNPARTWTPENAVGIGGAYMCVYGMEGPGGYQFVGRTLQMWNRFNVTAEFVENTPYLLRFFDIVRFYPVSAEELLQIRHDFPQGKFQIKIEESEFDIVEYTKFLQENDTAIKTFEATRNQAFQEEKERWIANGQLTYESHSVAEDPHASSVTLADNEEGIYAPVAGSVWKLKISAPGTTVKSGEILAILESMKTEIEIPAEENCVITQIHCKAASEVRNGQCLFAFRSTGV